MPEKQKELDPKAAQELAAGLKALQDRVKKLAGKVDAADKFVEEVDKESK